MLCTMALGSEAYYSRARRLCEDMLHDSSHGSRMLVLTDCPSAFDSSVAAAGLASIKGNRHELYIRHHRATGPLAADYLNMPAALMGDGGGTAAYHDKRFAIEAALVPGGGAGALFIDADTRIVRSDSWVSPNGQNLCVVGPHETVEEHLRLYGPERLKPFRAIAEAFDVPLDKARWVSESILEVTSKGPLTARFLTVWDQMAHAAASRNLFSGEGGIIGMAAHAAHLPVDEFTGAHCFAHEGGGPKR